jgi:hypothetical protein
MISALELWIHTNRYAYTIHKPTVTQTYCIIYTLLSYRRRFPPWSRLEPMHGTCHCRVRMSRLSARSQCHQKGSWRRGSLRGDWPRERREGTRPISSQPPSQAPELNSVGSSFADPCQGVGQTWHRTDPESYDSNQPGGHLVDQPYLLRPLRVQCSTINSRIILSAARLISPGFTVNVNTNPTPSVSWYWRL